jgi:hypothetical protein
MKKTGRLFALLLMVFLVVPAVFAQSGVTPSQDSSQTTMTVPTGTAGKVELQTPVHSKLNEVGDEVSGILVNSISVNGVIVLRKGTEVLGQITQITEAKRPQRQASMTIVFDRIITPEGEQEVDIVIKAIDDYVNEDKLEPKDEGKVQGGRSGGRTVDNAIKGGTLGTIVGIPVIIAAGTPGIAAPLGGVAAGVILTKGNEIRLSPGTIFRIEFGKPLNVQVDNSSFERNGRPARKNRGLRGNQD